MDLAIYFRKCTFGVLLFILLLSIVLVTSAQSQTGKMLGWRSTPINRDMLAKCVEPGLGDNAVCNSRGDCVRPGVCVCNSTIRGYYGWYCKKCPTCPGRCEELRGCVKCRMHETGEWEDEDDCYQNCAKYPEPNIVDAAIPDKNSDDKYCAFTDHSDGCRFYFVYGYTSGGKLTISAQWTKYCPPEPPTFWIVVGVGGGVLIGICCICVSVCTVVERTIGTGRVSTFEEVV